MESLRPCTPVRAHGQPASEYEEGIDLDQSKLTAARGCEPARGVFASIDPQRIRRIPNPMPSGLSLELCSHQHHLGVVHRAGGLHACRQASCLLLQWQAGGNSVDD